MSRQEQILSIPPLPWPRDRVVQSAEGRNQRVATEGQTEKIRVREQKKLSG